MTRISIKTSIDKSGLDKAKKALDDLVKHSVRVGFFENTPYPNGLTVASNAAIHNFGTKHIPARPFMDDAVKKMEESEADIAKIYSAAIEKGQGDIAAKRVGALAAQKIRESIRRGSFPALQKETIRRKGSSKPLIDTGLLIGSVEFKED